jgi:hypothetical protein
MVMVMVMVNGGNGDTVSAKLSVDYIFAIGSMA